MVLEDDFQHCPKTWIQFDSTEIAKIFGKEMDLPAGESWLFAPSEVCDVCTFSTPLIPSRVDTPCSISVSMCSLKYK